MEVLLTFCPPAPLARYTSIWMSSGSDLDIDVVVDLRHDLQRGKGGLTAPAGIEGRNTHQAVHAVFAFEEAVGVHPLDEDGGAFDARFVAVQIVQHFIRL